MKPEMIILVDEHDTIIGEVERDKKTSSQMHRVSALWLRNSRGDILLAKRHRNKNSNPGMWGPAVAGTNEVGETYESNIKKESAEEIGLTDTDFSLGKKIRREEYFCQWFTAVVDRDAADFILQENEVEEVRWWPKETLRMTLRETPEIFLKSLPRYFEMFEGKA